MVETSRSIVLVCAPTEQNRWKGNYKKLLGMALKILINVNFNVQARWTGEQNFHRSLIHNYEVQLAMGFRALDKCS